jgi:acetyl-CoA carboxylase carboxyltransferase component
MGPEGAVNILYRRDLEAAADPAALRARLVAEFRDKLANPFIAAARGFVDEIIAPRATRAKLIAALVSCDGKRARKPPKKHGNIPL